MLSLLQVNWHFLKLMVLVIGIRPELILPIWIFLGIYLSLEWLTLEGNNFDTIFRSLSKEQLQNMTSPEICSTPDESLIYISWNEFEWTFSGKINRYNISMQEVCPRSDRKVKIFLPSIFFSFLTKYFKATCRIFWPDVRMYEYLSQVWWSQISKDKNFER